MNRLLRILFWIILCAILCGGLGFIAGFFGPLIFLPDANQGPLVGIFFTGPAGIILGAIIGLVVGIRKTRNL